MNSIITWYCPVCRRENSTPVEIYEHTGVSTGPMCRHCVTKFANKDSGLVVDELFTKIIRFKRSYYKINPKKS